MNTTLEKLQSKKQEHLKIERFLLKQAYNCSQKLADFYRNVICYHIGENKIEIAEEKYNLLADNDTVKFFFDITERSYSLKIMLKKKTTSAAYKTIFFTPTTRNYRNNKQYILQQRYCRVVLFCVVVR